MAVPDLNAYARPYLRRPNRPRHSPLQVQPPPPSVTPPPYYYGSAGCQPPFPLVPNYAHATFPEESYHPLPPQPSFFRNHAPSPPHHLRRGGPRGLMFPNNRGGVVCEKLYAQAMFRYNNARVVAAAAVGGRRDPAAPRRGGLAACGPRAWTRGRDKAHVRAGGRARRSPSPAFTTRPETWIPPPAWLGRTTVMIRNIPNRLTRALMMELLDDHCARENRRRRGGRAAAAYDFIYVPMDFRQERCSNKGYAFVNFTTPDAARGLHFALHGCGWKPWLRSYKTVHIDAAHIQGKRTLVRRFTRSTFVCRTDEFLPAVFWPPRDGATHTAPRNLGLRIPPLVSPVQRLQLQKVVAPTTRQPVPVQAS